MANAIKCDRCGRCVLDKYYYFSYKKGNIRHGTISGSYTNLDCDLCPECVEDFKKFMKNDSKKASSMDKEFVFAIFDESDEELNGYMIKSFRGIFDNLDQAKKAIERPNFKNFKWKDETHYEYNGINMRHYGVITPVPKNELFYN